ncbi:MAG: hypothetical protein AB7T22_12925 [Calditrichaceae bacterium]
MGKSIYFIYCVAEFFGANFLSEWKNEKNSNNNHELKFARAFCYFLAIQKVGREE